MAIIHTQNNYFVSTKLNRYLWTKSVMLLTSKVCITFYERRLFCKYPIAKVNTNLSASNLPSYFNNSKLFFFIVSYASIYREVELAQVEIELWLVALKVNIEVIALIWVVYNWRVRAFLLLVIPKVPLDWHCIVNTD